MREARWAFGVLCLCQRSVQRASQAALPGLGFRV